MKKVILIFCVFNSLLGYSQLDTELITKAKGISKNDQSEIEENTLSLIYETFDVRVSYKNEVIKLNVFEIYPELKKVTKINQVVIFNSEKKEMFSQKFNSTEVKIVVQNFPLGAYNIYIKTDNGHVNKQFIKK